MACILASTTPRSEPIDWVRQHVATDSMELARCRRVCLISSACSRGFSLIELVAVLLILGLLSSMAITRFGEGAYTTLTAEGFVRCLVLDLRQARARTISTGDNHYVLFSRTDSVITSYTLYRSPGTGDVVVDRTVTIPDNIVVTTATDQWEFEFDGSLGAGTGSGTITVTGPNYIWTLTIYRATGRIRAAKVAVT